MFDIGRAVKSYGKTSLVLRRLEDLKSEILGLGSEYVDRATLDMLAWYAKEYIGSDEISRRLINAESKYSFEFDDDDFSWVKPGKAQQVYVISLINHMKNHISMFGLAKKERMVFFRRWSDREIVLSVLTLCVSVFFIGKWVGDYEITKKLVLESGYKTIHEPSKETGNVIVDTSLHYNGDYDERKDTNKQQTGASIPPTIPMSHNK